MKLGVLGGGQLGRMLGLAGIPLGLRFRFLDASAEVPAAAVGEVHAGAYTDLAALARFAAGLDLVTLEFENVPADACRTLARTLPVLPGARALAEAQDRLREKTLFRELGIPVPRFAPVDDATSLQRALGEVGLPAVLKTRRLGYDGKGQVVLREAADAVPALAALGGRELILEEWIPFERELSLLAVRSRGGALACYPLVENQHRGGILALSRSPARGITPALEQEADRHARALLERLEYAGVLAIEFFQRDGRLLANEIAPRVHNSGHWTIEGAVTSQFENHLRAVLGWPLGDTAPRGHAAMINLVGTHPPAAELARLPRTHVHLYGKEPRAGRKLGHLTLVEASPSELERHLDAVLRAVRPELAGA
ncbi:MAG: 5-(carboxyamino)imidazole ribonucleotide synthase [Planctomycetes bacterium]|nr:5-(carboxyamino)imidazole ribonucleotide synthase [Planctomycetota bacterium]